MVPAGTVCHYQIVHGVSPVLPLVPVQTGTTRRILRFHGRDRQVQDLVLFARGGATGDAEHRRHAPVPDRPFRPRHGGHKARLA